MDADSDSAILQIQTSADDILVNLAPKTNEICWAMRREPQLGLCRFMATTALMRS